MADYYPLLARAVAALPNSTRETRTAIYDRARKALLGQLRSLEPPVSEEHLQTESDALDASIARLESELAQGSKTDGPQDKSADGTKSEDGFKSGDGLKSGEESKPAPRGEVIAPARSAAAPPPRPIPPPPSSSAARTSPPPPLPPATAPLGRPPAPPTLSHASPPTTARAPLEAKPSAPAGAPLPPSVSSQSQRPAQAPPKPLDAPTSQPGAAAQSRPDSAPAPERAPPAAPSARPAAPPVRDSESATPPVPARAPTSAARGDATRPAVPIRPETGRGVSRQMLIWIPLILLIGGGIGFAAWRLRVPQEDFAKPRATVAEAARPQGAAKINERAGGPANTAPATPAQPTAPAQPPRAADQPARQPAAPQQQAQTQPATQQPPRPAAEPTAPVAQRSAILVQAAVNDMQNVETHIGTTVWRVEESRRPGANGSPAVRADVDIAAVGMKFVLLIEKNNDATLRASHMMTLRFLPQEGAAIPGVAEIGTPQMRNESSPAVEPLAGAQAKITDNIYIVALSADPTLVSRNIDTLKTRGWFDIPIRLADGRISKITIEKGAPGDRLIEQALEQWQR